MLQKYITHHLDFTSEMFQFTSAFCNPEKYYEKINLLWIHAILGELGIYFPQNQLFGSVISKILRKVRVLHSLQTVLYFLWDEILLGWFCIVYCRARCTICWRTTRNWIYNTWGISYTSCCWPSCIIIQASCSRGSWRHSSRQMVRYGHGSKSIKAQQEVIVTGRYGIILCCCKHVPATTEVMRQQNSASSLKLLPHEFLKFPSSGSRSQNSLLKFRLVSTINCPNIHRICSCIFWTPERFHV